jgi:hypothetical protein
MSVQIAADYLAEVWPAKLRGARIGALLHPASVSSMLVHTSKILERESGKLFQLGAFFAFCLLSILSTSRADIPWPEVARRFKFENEKLASRPQGHNGDYLVVCTFCYTPMESGFTAERGFDGTPVAARGLHGHQYPRDFCAW